jgi:acetate CoA/acetoacetate CoA-transferase alpha subunit
MNKIQKIEEAVSQIKNGDTVLVGGFYGVGTPHNIIDEMIRQNKKELTVITVEAGSPNYGVAKLLENRCVKKLIATWMGDLKHTVNELIEEGSMELEINPQGTLVERIRAGGYGLGGILTPTGLGTYVEEKGIGERYEFNGKAWLYHTPIKGDVCIVEAYGADVVGNLLFRGTQNNFNDMMCTSADLVIASIMCPICEKGEIEPIHVQVPGIYVDILVQGTEEQVERSR